MLKNVTKLSSNKLIDKVIATILIITLTFVNLLFLGSYVTETFAAIKDIEEQDATTNNKNIKFDAYFTTQDNSKTHSAIMDISNPATLSLYLKVEQDGYLKNATIEFKGQETGTSTNFDITGQLSGARIMQSVSYKEKRIALRQINKNTEATLIVPLGIKIEENFDLTKLNQNNVVILKGTYIDGKGKETEIKTEKVVNIGWIGKYTNNLESKVEKYVPYNIDDKKGVMIQTTVTTYSKEANTLPVKEENIVAKVPMFNDFAPENVIVTAKSIRATTGQTEQNAILTEEEWNYNKDEQTVSINIKNNDSIKNVWSGNGKDVFYITYIYPEAAYASIKDEPIKLESDIYSKISVYNNDSTIDVENTYKLETELKEKIGNIVTYELENKEKNIVKGNMYANYQSEKSNYETEFSTKWNINIAYKELLESLQVQDAETYFSDEEENLYATKSSTENYTYYKQTKISKENFEKILGIDGYIQILDKNDKLIHTINKDITVDSDNNYTVNYEGKYDVIKISTSKPILEGNLIIENVKSITYNLGYSKLQVSKFNKLITRISGYEKYINETNYKELPVVETDSNLKETQTQTNLVLNTETFSTLVENKNIEMKLELNNNVNTSDLYQNPVFQIEFPSYIESVNVKKQNIKILYSDELKLQDVKTIKVNGKTILQIFIKGTQTKFSEGINNGTNIVITADIKANVATPAVEEEIKLSYFNENAIKYASETKWNIEGKQKVSIISRDEFVNGMTSAKIKFAAPSGLVNATSISNFDEKNSTVISVKQGEILGQIEIADSKKTINTKLLVVNNFENACENITILGRIPFKNNKSILTGEDLGSTFNTTLRSKIVPDGIDKDKVTVYYSENGEATADLNDASNGWITNPNNYGKIKSFLMVTTNYVLEAGTAISLGFNVEIPENLKHNNTIFGTFATYYTNNIDGTGTLEAIEADKVGLTTGAGPEIELQKTISVGNNSPVKELKRVKYTITAKNTGDNPVEDVVVRDTIPDGTMYTKYQASAGESDISGYVVDTTTKNLEWRLGTIQPNKSISVEYEVLVKQLPTIYDYYKDLKLGQDDNGQFYVVNDDGSKGETLTLPEIKIVSAATVEAKELGKKLSSNELKNTVEKSNFDIDFKTYVSKETKLKENEELVYTGTVRNITEKTIENVIAKNKIPDGLKYKDAYIEKYEEVNGEDKLIPVRDGVTYDKLTKEVIFNIGSIKNYDQAIVTIETEVAEFGTDVYEKTFVNKLDVITDGVTESSEEIVNIAGRPKLSIDMKKSLDVNTLYEKEEAEFIITVKNEGTMSANNINIIDQIPEGLYVNKVEYKINNETMYTSANSNGLVDIITTIPEDSTLTIRIGVIVNRFLQDIEQKEVENYAVLKTDNEELRTQTLKYTLKKVETTENVPGNKTYNISGIVWIDADENGKRDELENTISGVTVKLLSATNNSVLRTTVTDSNCKYEFKDLEKGNYLVVIMYNTSMYRITDYHKADVSNDLNSDFISTTLEEEGNSQLAAVTDTIKVEGANRPNIDLGLIESEQFDLSLTKQLSHITVQDKTGVTHYDYQNTTTAKIDLNEKYTAGTNVIIEYKIVVKNEGAVAGYVRKIVDYLTKDLAFKSELNTNWYIGQDGYLYNKELEDVVIYPGEQKEVKLILTKTMTEDNLGMVNNTAEIHETYNKEGLMDIDSTPANMVQGEDDMGSADVFLSIRTGGSPILYTSIILLSLVVVGTGIFFINKKVLKPRKTT